MHVLYAQCEGSEVGVRVIFITSLDDFYFAIKKFSLG
jgi:hypothetical protein